MHALHGVIQHPDDLAFYTGDIIDVEESSTEKNEDWWTGKVRGQSGLFPSNYVERILHSLPPPPPAPMISKSSRPGSEVGVTPTYVPYRSTHAAMNSYPVGGGPNALGLQPSQPPQQSGSEEPKRAGKYDHLKGTVCPNLVTISISILPHNSLIYPLLPSPPDIPSPLGTKIRK